ncbi:MAG: MoxR family ATPase, partial [Micrococcales bacterium]|nr:MoxR family ATPase [Micrococcales bacterium]
RTYALPRPFLVVATQNPVEMEGTYPLPEAQRDRFMARLAVGYPEPAAELEMLERQETSDPLLDVAAVTTPEHIAQLADVVRRLYASSPVKRYVVALVGATRQDPSLRLGASPRAAIQLLRAAKSLAAMAGRDHVLPDDVQQLAVPVLAHRLLPSTESRLSGRTTADIVTDVVTRVPLPTPAPVRIRRATG